MAQEQKVSLEALGCVRFAFQKKKKKKKRKSYSLLAPGHTTTTKPKMHKTIKAARFMIDCWIGRKEGRKEA